jgi:hypothetical protein
VRFTLTGAATVIFTVSRLLDGRRVGGRCVPVSRRNHRAAACRRWQRVPGAFVMPAGAGVHTGRFSGRLDGAALPPGTYQLTATPVAGGRRGVPARVRFVVVR